MKNNSYICHHIINLLFNPNHFFMKKITTLGLMILMMLGLSLNTKAQGTVQCSIENNSTISELTEGPVYFYVENATNYSVSWAYCPLNYVNDDGTDGSLIDNYMVQFDKETGKVYVNLEKYRFWPDYPFRKEGKYKFTMPADAFQYDLTDDSGNVVTEKNKETTITFTIDNDPAYVNESNITFTPTAPADLEEVPTFTITLPEDVTSVDFNEVEAGSSSYYGTITAKAQLCKVYSSGSYSSFGTLSITANGNVLTLTPDPGIDVSSGGNYVIRILRNSMYFNGDETKTNDLIYSGYYTFPERAKIVLEPETGTKFISWPAEFTVDYTANSIACNDEMLPSLNIYNEGTNTYEKVCDMIVTMPEPDSWDYPTLSIDQATAESLKYGKYRIIIEKGQFTTTSYSGNELINGYYAFDYEYIATPTISLIPTSSIEEGTTVESFKEVTLTFSEATEIGYDNMWTEPYITINQVVDGVATPWGGSSGYLDVEITGNQVVLYMDESTFTPNYPIDVDGDYRVILPAGKLHFEGIPDFTNDEFVLNFKVDAPEPAFTVENTTIDPAPSTVKHMAHTFTITVNDVEGELSVANVPTDVWNDEISDYEEQMLPAQARLMLDSGGYMSGVGMFNISANNNIITLTPDESSMSVDQSWYPGNYILMIPKGAILVDNDPQKTNGILEYKPYVIEHLISGEFTNPTPGIVESLKDFSITLYDCWEEASNTNLVPAVLSKYDETSGEWTALDNTVNVTTGFDWDLYECTASASLSAEVTEAGKYKITIPQGCIEWPDAYAWEDPKPYYNDVIEGEFIIADSSMAFIPISIDPADGSELTELSKITITYDAMYFPNGLYDAGADVSILNAEGNEVMTGWLSCTQAETGSNPTLVINIDEPITTAGNYTVIVPENKVQDYVSEGDNKFNNPEIRLTYTVIDMAKIFKPLSINPEEGEVISLKDFTIEFDPTNFIDGMEANGMDPYAYVYNADNEEVTKGMIYFSSAPYTTATFSLEAEISDPGTYTLVLKEGVLIDYVNKSNVNPEMKFVYTIAGTVTPPPVIEMNVTPAGGADTANATKLIEIGDNTFSIEFVGAETVTINNASLDWNNPDIINLWDINEAFEMGNNNVAFYPVADEGNALKFNLVKFEESMPGCSYPITQVGLGYYYLNIPSGIFICDGNPSEEYSGVYTMEAGSIKAVDMTAQDKNVYSVNGMLIKKNASWNEILDLEPGIYVVNGEKVYIRK